MSKYIPAHIRGAIVRDLAHLETSSRTPAVKAFADLARLATPKECIYNVEFAGDDFWIGTTIIATDKDSAIDIARDHIVYTSQIPVEIISQMPHVEAEYLGEAE